MPSFIVSPCERSETAHKSFQHTVFRSVRQFFSPMSSNIVVCRRYNLIFLFSFEAYSVVFFMEIGIKLKTEKEKITNDKQIDYGHTFNDTI